MTNTTATESTSFAPVAASVASSDTEIRPFRVDIPQADIDDLQYRLAHTRYPLEAPGDAWKYGATVEFVRDFVKYWRTEFDWRAQEERINAFPQFTTQIDGQNIHFIHVKSKEAGALPLILTHGWPSSFADYLDMIGPLTDPVAFGGRAEDAFDVVIPSMPGFGFSGQTTESGWTMARIAQTWDTLMKRLGYQRYGAHGTDGGAQIGRELGLLHPDGLVGTHVLQLFSFPSGDPAEFALLSEKDLAGMAFLETFQERAGFSAAMSSRPQSLAFGLSDSPAAQLAWSELLVGFGDGSLLTKDQILTTVSIYWFTNTSASAARSYYEEAHSGAQPAVNAAPTGVAVFADDFRTIRAFADRDNSNIIHWSEFDQGGHWAAAEVPEVLSGDLRDFFRVLR